MHPANIGFYKNHPNTIILLKIMAITIIYMSYIIYLLVNKISMSKNPSIILIHPEDS